MHVFRKNLAGSVLTLLMATTASTGFSAQDNYDAAYAKLRSNPGNFSWLQERSIEDVNFANMILCKIKKSAADNIKMVGAGPYVVAVQEGICDKSQNITAATQDGSTSTQVRYEYSVVDSQYDAATNTLTAKFWIRPTETELEDVRADSRRYVKYTHGKVTIKLPASEVGFDEVSWVHLPVDVNTGAETSNSFSQAIGYGAMRPVSDGNGGFTISHVNFYKSYWNPDGFTKWMNLARTGPRGSVSLIGTVSASEWDNNLQKDVSIPYNLNANDTEFVRSRYNSATNTWGAPICFDRTNVKYNTWNYNLYDEAGNLINITSNVNVNYTGSNNTHYRGNYSNNGFWIPDAAQAEIATAGTVNVEVEGQSGSKQAGVVTVRNGSLRKVVNTQTVLSDLDSVILNYWKCPSGGTCSNVQIAWNSTQQKFVYVSNGVIGTTALQDSDLPQGDLWVNTNTGINYVIRGVWSSGANGWKVYWSSILGNSAKATSRQEKRLTTAELNALSGVTLNCIGNCPMWNGNVMNTYNAGKQYVSNGALNQASNNGSAFGFSYTFNPSTGKLYNAAQQTALEYTAFKASSVTSSNSVQSGPLIPVNVKSLADLSKAAKCNANDADANTTNVCPWNYENTLSEYYIWRSGERQWEKDWNLTVNGVTPTLDDQMYVTYTCPANREGCASGAKSVLNYNGPGRLWGIPNKCVDAENYMVACTSATKNQQWINKFNLTSSPVDTNKSTDFVVDAAGKKYFILPQGSGEFYPQKNSCGLTLGTPQPQVNVADIFSATKVDLSPAPLDPLTAPVSVRDGEIVNK
jgi:hypothetical protein